MANVKLKQVVKSFGETKVIHGIDLDIKSGEFVVFVGPSGCGKSTLLRMIAGLETTTSGDIMIGTDRVNDLPPRSRDIAMVFQDYALYPHKSVFENMAFGLRLRKTPEAEIKKRVGDAAAILQIEHLLERKPRQLSGGQRQRVAMGRAIVRDPKAFLFDEPLSNLDAQLRNEMRTEIKKLHARLGKTIIYVTHDQVEAMTLADRIAVLSAGHVMQYASPDEIYNRPAAKFVAGFTGSPSMNFAPGKVSADGTSVLVAGSNVKLGYARASAAGSDVTFGVRPEDISLSGENADAIAARVVVVEPLGAETLVTLAIGESKPVEMITRVDADTKLLSGDQVKVSINAAKTHVFDLKSELAITA
ncbi:MAG: sn-glycerol-3-phosphate ABC transporter ATP-binding protein UgpC [Betaproteobacteria bacterium]|nr:MAG: sn-glycerol-3-phosphate ABC transporter ATP-binding protein UgpC [Betaproteobacteria bacterium]